MGLQKIQIAVTLLVPEGDMRWEATSLEHMVRESEQGDWALSWEVLEHRILTEAAAHEACEALACDPDFFGLGPLDEDS